MIIGIAGSYGSGKGAVVDYLTAKGFTHYSASGFISEEVAKRGLPLNRDSLILVANDLRREFGPTHIVDVLYERAKNAGGNVIIEALRAVSEVRRIKELGGIVIGVDADPDIRYARIVKRGSAKDHVSREQFLDQESREINPDDPAKQDIFNALKQSDYLLNNDGSLEELQAQVDGVLATFAR